MIAPEAVVTLDGTRRSMAGRIVLAVAGLVMILIGGALLTVPQAFNSGSGIDYAGNASLLSEARAGGGGLLAVGVLVALGAYVRRLAFTAALVGSTVYLAYGLSRLVGMVVDGLPAQSLVVATVAELVVGTACGWQIVSHRRRRGSGQVGALAEGAGGAGHSA